MCECIGAGAMPEKKKTKSMRKNSYKGKKSKKKLKKSQKEKVNRNENGRTTKAC